MPMAYAVWDTRIGALTRFGMFGKQFFETKEEAAEKLEEKYGDGSGTERYRVVSIEET